MRKTRRCPLPGNITIAIVLTGGWLALLPTPPPMRRAGEKAAQIVFAVSPLSSRVGAPTLEQQPSKYLVAQITLFKSGKRVKS